MLFQTDVIPMQVWDKEIWESVIKRVNRHYFYINNMLYIIHKNKLENYQTPEGIVVPKVLRKYNGFDIIN